MAEPLYDALTEESVRNHLKTDHFNRVDVYGTVVSTNTLLRDNAGSLPDRSAAIASRQTGGRGRRGHTFFSPDGTGLYMSMLLRPGTDAETASGLTTIAAVAVCRAIELTLGLEPWIKWVNDVFLGERKVCGILTEAVARPGADIRGPIDFAVVGVGINVYEPEGGFPPQIADIAGALTGERRSGLRGRLAAALLDSFGRLYGAFPEDDGYIEEYRRRCAVIGREIRVLTPDGGYDALAAGIDGRCRLIVEKEDGTRAALSSGEISIRLKDGRKQ